MDYEARFQQAENARKTGDLQQGVKCELCCTMRDRLGSGIWVHHTAVSSSVGLVPVSR